MQNSSWTQLNLLFSTTSQNAPVIQPDEAHRRRIVGLLTIRLPDPVDLVFTDNHSTMISFSHRQGRFRIRLHRMFRHADSRVLEHLARFITKRTKLDSIALDRFISEHREEIRDLKISRPKRLREEGTHHDLKQVLTKVATTYFAGCTDVRIGWGAHPKRRSPKRRRRAITRALATYSYDDRTIRVSPVLDAADVPDYVVEWIVYHEMLHHVLPVEKVGERNQYHTRKFRMLERAFKDFEKAKAWEETHLEKLLK
jgi:predicted metal-dependent hydrolase